MFHVKHLGVQLRYGAVREYDVKKRGKEKSDGTNQGEGYGHS